WRTKSAKPLVSFRWPFGFNMLEPGESICDLDLRSHELNLVGHASGQQVVDGKGSSGRVPMRVAVDQIRAVGEAIATNRRRQSIQPIWQWRFFAMDVPRSQNPSVAGELAVGMILDRRENRDFSALGFVRKIKRRRGNPRYDRLFWGLGSGGPLVKQNPTPDFVDLSDRKRRPGPACLEKRNGISFVGCPSWSAIRRPREIANPRQFRVGPGLERHPGKGDPAMAVEGWALAEQDQAIAIG